MIILENEPLDADQKSALLEYIEKLTVWVQKFGISSEPIEFDEAEEFATEHPNLLFSLGEDDHRSPASEGVMGLEAGLVPGFEEGSEVFYISKNPWADEDEDWPYTEIFFECMQCPDLSNPGENCDSCEGGQFVYELLWNQHGEVSFERQA